MDYSNPAWQDVSSIILMFMAGICVIVIGFLKAQKLPFIFCTQNLGRVLLELAVLQFILWYPASYIAVQIKLGHLSSNFMHLASAYRTLAPIASLGLGLWYAARYSNTAQVNSSWLVQSGAFLLKILAVFTTLFLAQVSAEIFVPGLQLYVARGVKSFLPLVTGLMPSIVYFCFIPTIAGLIFECLAEAITSVTRGIQNANAISPSQSFALTGNLEKLLQGGFIVTIICIGLGFSVRVAAPSEDVYIPPVYLPLVRSAGSTSPLEVLANQAFSFTLPTSLFVFMGWLIAFKIYKRTPNGATFVFGALCLMYATQGIIVFSNSAGQILWGARNAISLLMMPTQIHFLALFPRSTAQHPVFFKTVYARFVLLLPTWTLFNFIDPQSLAHCALFVQGSCIEGRQALLLTQALGLYLPILFGWIATFYILAIKLLNFSTRPSSTSPCHWLDAIGDYKGQLLLQEYHQLLRLIISLVIGLCLALALLVTLRLNWGLSAQSTLLIAQFTFSLVLVISIFSSLYQDGLWRSGRSLLVANILVFFINFLGSALLASRLENILSAAFAGFAVVLATRIPIEKLTDWLKQEIYRISIGQNLHWNHTLDKVIDDLNNINAQNQLANWQSIIQRALPPGIYDAWLLIRINHKQTNVFEVRSLNPQNPCAIENHQILTKKIGLAVGSTEVILEEWFIQIIARALGTRPRQIIETSAITLHDTEPDIPMKLFDFLTYQRSFHAPVAFWRKLNELQIALVAPLGSTDNIQGIILISTNGVGDYYSPEDLTTFAQVTSTIFARYLAIQTQAT